MEGAHGPGVGAEGERDARRVSGSEGVVAGGPGLAELGHPGPVEDLVGLSDHEPEVAAARDEVVQPMPYMGSSHAVNVQGDLPAGEVPADGDARRGVRNGTAAVQASGEGQRPRGSRLTRERAADG